MTREQIKYVVSALTNLAAIITEPTHETKPRYTASSDCV
jgi:hypothetical protein